MTDALVVLVTEPLLDDGPGDARRDLEERLAACGNVLPGVRSIYRWEGKLQDEPEVLLVLKTRRSRFAALRDRILALHPYETPEVIALPVEAGSDAYLDWIAGST